MRKEVLRSTIRLSYIIFIYYIAFSQFPSKVRKSLLERAGGKCEHCKKSFKDSELIGSHIKHGTEKDLQVETNGWALCLSCETEYHLKNADNPETINLSVVDNDSAVNSRILELLKYNYHSAKNLIKKYPSQCNGVLQRLKKDSFE